MKKKQFVYEFTFFFFFFFFFCTDGDEGHNKRYDKGIG